MSTVRSEPPTANFTVIRNELINDSSLSVQARMLMIYLLSKPDSWQVNPSQLETIADDSRIPFKRRAVYAALGELKDAGYVRMNVVRSSKGIAKYTYTVFDCPQVEVSAIIPESEPKPRKAGSNPPVTFAEFCQLCDDAGEKRIQPDDPVFEDMQAAGIPAEYLALHWRWFVRWAGELDAKGKDRRYAGQRGWRQVFRKSVRECWSKLWYKDNKSGQWCLTQAGMMAQAAKTNGRE